jgi:hypothetical protein
VVTLPTRRRTLTRKVIARTPDAVNIDRLAAGVLAETYAELRTFSATAYPDWVTDGMIAYVRSRATDGDGGDGYFRYVVGDTSSDNGGTILEAGSDAWNRTLTAVLHRLVIMPSFLYAMLLKLLFGT